jgi:hypothetical protein
MLDRHCISRHIVFSLSTRGIESPDRHSDDLNSLFARVKRASKWGFCRSAMYMSLLKMYEFWGVSMDGS